MSSAASDTPIIVTPYCLATLVTQKAIETLLEASGQGSYRDVHPWLVAQDLLTKARENEQQLPLLLASKPEEDIPTFSHWTLVSAIDVVELHRGEWESRCHFSTLTPVNPIFADVSSLFVYPSEEQRQREAREHIRVYRQALDEHHIHPYAVAETPVFIVQELKETV